MWFHCVFFKFSYELALAVIDLYEGEELGENIKSMTFKIVFQSFDSTLSTNEIDNTQQKILKSLKHQLNIEQRYWYATKSLPCRYD